MGNRVMKNDKSSLRTVEREFGSNVDADHQSSGSGLMVPIDEDYIESKIVVEDATSIIIDSPSASTTEYESASASDNDMTSLNRLSSCTDVSSDISFETPDLAVAVTTTVEMMNQVSAACVGSVVFSPEEDEFHSLTEHDPPRADDEQTSDEACGCGLNSIVEHRSQPEGNAQTPFLEMRGKPKPQSLCASVSEFSRVSDALCDVLNKVSVVLGNYHQDTQDLRLVEMCSRRLVEALNLRARFPEVFDFNSQKVILSYNGFVYQLQEQLVDTFLAHRVSHLDALNVVVFELVSAGHELSYLARVNEKQMIIFSRLIALLLKRLGDGSELVTVSLVTEKPHQESLTTCKDGLCESIADNILQSNNYTKSDVMNCEGENVSEAGPTTAANIDSINNIPLLNDSCDLEFISKVGGTGVVAENLRNQSLYVKFDPLVANEASNASMNGDTTLTNDVCDSTLNDTAVDTNSRQISDERHNFSAEVTDSNEPIGKLISVTPNRSPRKKKTKAGVTNEQLGEGQSQTPKSSPRFPDTDPDDLNELKSLLLKQMKREEAFKEEIESVRREHEQTLQRLQNVEKENNQLRSALDVAQENEKKLKNELKERIKSKQQLSMVMEEYEKTISQMVTRRDEEKREFDASVRKIEAERDSTIQHLNNLENAFNDVHQKYERGKIVNEALKKNEDILKKSLTEYEVTVKTVENKYELLKSHATSQLEKANQELELITQTYEKEQAKLKAMLRKTEIQVNSLQNSLDQKAKENQELTAVCDELIVKLSTHSNA